MPMPEWGKSPVCQSLARVADSNRMLRSAMRAGVRLNPALAHEKKPIPEKVSSMLKLKAPAQMDTREAVAENEANPASTPRVNRLTKKRFIRRISSCPTDAPSEYVAMSASPADPRP